MTEKTLGEAFPDLLGAARTGADWALTSLFRQYQPALLRYLRARAGDEAEDLASDTWLCVAKSLGSFDGDETHFRRWLYTIAGRRLTDHLRRQSRRPSTAATDDVLAAVPQPGDTADEVVSAVAGDEAARRIARALSPGQAEVVLLRVVGGFSAEEVAAITGRRAGTVRVLAHRGLARLAVEFSDGV